MNKVNSPACRPLFSWVLLLALAPFTSKSMSQTSDGAVDLMLQGVDETYVVNLYENGNHAGPGYAAALDVAATDPGAGSAVLPSGSYYLYCVELGQDAAGGYGTPNSPETYHILDSGSLGYVDSTNLAFEPNAQANVGPMESAAGITATGGIGAYRAGQLELLYGYAFGSSGVLSSGYNPASLSAQDQVAFQLAVWKLAYEGTQGSAATLYSNPGGSSVPGLSVTGVNGLIASANSLLQGVADDKGITPMALDALNNGTYQDFLIPASLLTQIPEPSAYAAILSLVTLVFTLIRRRLSTTA
jgi:hypothetical protein